MMIGMRMTMTFFCGMDLGSVSKINHWESTYHSFSMDWNWR